MADMQWLDGGITAVPGILASGIAAGIKPSGKKDLALIYSSAPARAAAVFTSNQVKGAPVIVSQEHVRDGRAQAIVASSGCANVCTGEQGVKDAREMTKTVGDLLRIKPSQVLIAATGVIGQPLPMDKIRAALPKLVKGLSPQGGRSAADAIIASDALPRVLRRAVDASLNRITVDGDQSTSDTVAVLANGLAENAPLERGSRGLRQFARGLEAVMGRLARMLVADGEGATKVVEVAMSGARTRREAEAAARAVANSPLVKTAINGADPNWGRLMMALGKSPARVVPDKVAIRFGDEALVEKGMLKPGARLDRIRALMGQPEYTIRIDLGLGRGRDTVWTSDLSEEYVRINGKSTT